jgi:hypothetical protein
MKSKLSYNDPELAPCYKVWTVKPVNFIGGKYVTDHHTIIKRYVINSTQRKMMDKLVVLRRFEARLQLKYWDCHVQTSPIMRTPEVKERDRLLIDRTSLRRKVTLYRNRIEKYREHQKTLLIQTYDEKYDKAVAKLQEAIKDLNQVEQKIKQRNECNQESN